MAIKRKTSSLFFVSLSPKKGHIMKFAAGVLFGVAIPVLMAASATAGAVYVYYNIEHFEASAKNLRDKKQSKTSTPPPATTSEEP